MNAGSQVQKKPIFKQVSTICPNLYPVLCILFTQIAAEVSAPLAKTEEIVMLGGSDHLTGEVTRLVGQIPPAVNALTGVDLTKVIENQITLLPWT